MVWESAGVDAELPQDDTVVSRTASPLQSDPVSMEPHLLSIFTSESLFILSIADISFAHDGSTAAVLGILQADYPIWPGMASEIVFELWQKGKGDYIRVLFSGQPLVTSTKLGTLVMVRLEVFEEYLESILPKDIVKACQSL
jgi:hypothetical protein